MTGVQTCALPILAWIFADALDDPDSARAHARLALMADPGWHVPYYIFAFLRFLSGDCPGTVAALDTVRQLSPTYSITPEVLGRCRLLDGDTSGVRELARQAGDLGNPMGYQTVIGLLAARSGQWGVVRQLAGELAGNQVPDGDARAAILTLAAGDTSGALTLLERRPQIISSLEWPELAPLRSRPRFRLVLGAAHRRQPIYASPGPP